VLELTVDWLMACPCECPELPSSGKVTCGVEERPAKQLSMDVEVGL
jgi:hypothetical protein